MNAKIGTRLKLKRAAWVPVTNAMAAPRTAPDEIPSIYGSAMGFLNIPWNSTPQIDKPVPQRIEVRIRGSLSENIMVEYVSGRFLISTYFPTKGILERIIFMLSMKPMSAEPLPAENIIAARRDTTKAI
jgi:hypothetical protein